MSTIENLGNTKTIRIGEMSSEEVFNNSQKVGIIHNERIIPLLGEEGAFNENGIYEISGANKLTLIDAEVKDNYIYAASRTEKNFDVYDVSRFSLKTGRKIDSWDSQEFKFFSKAERPYTMATSFGNEAFSQYPFLKDDFRKFREEFSFLSIPEHGTGSISSTTSSGDESIEISSPNKFKVKNIDKISNFDPSTDTLEIDTDSFGIDSSATFAAGKNKKAVKKKLAKQDFDFLYDEKKGGLYFNENGANKGFGDGGMIAILKGSPNLTGSNLEFI